jgi:hypothetical protein
MQAPDGLNNLADQLFAEKPAREQDSVFDWQTGAHRYVQSRVFSGSRGLDPQNGPPNRLADDALDSELLHAERLGPYERELLASLLRAPQSLVIVTGSTGAGKSSTLRHILDFYDNNAGLKNVQAHVGWNPKHAYVDFNKLEREFARAESEKHGAGLDLLYDKIPWRIATALLKSVNGVALQRKCTSRQVVLDLAREAYRWLTDEEPVPDGMTFDWPDLLAVGAPELTGNPDRDFDALQRRLADVAQRKSRSNIPLMFWCAVFDALAIKSRPINKRALLLLDNIDPLPDEVQRALRDEFLCMCLEKNFKVVLALRHSRFRIHEPRQRYALEYNWYPHCGPSPVEIVCDRLLGFIAKPECYPAFRDLTHEWQQRSLQRALDLLLRLTRGSPHFRTLGQLAVAGAGDSVRRALDTIRSMFECREISFGYASLETTAAISQLSLELKAISCSGALGLALREELIGIAMECSKDQHDFGVQRAVQRLVRTTLSVLRGGFDRTDQWSQPNVDRLWEHAEVQAMLVEDIETAASLLQERLTYLGMNREATSSVRARLAAALREAFAGYCAKPSRPGLSALFDLICTLLATDHPQQENSREEGTEFTFSWDRLRICANALSANRSHVMARSLIRRESLHNLLVDSEKKPSLLPLTLLYYLAFRDHGEAPLSDVLSLARLDADEAGILSLINRLCNERGRILWINQDFSHGTFQELATLARSGATIKLTHGGWAYFLAVLDEIDYLMEAAAPAVAGRDELLSTRLKWGLERLQGMLKLRPSPRASSDPLWQAIQTGVTADLIVRCTPGLIRAARGHFSKMQDPRTSMAPQLRFSESRETRQLCIDWLKMLQETQQRTGSGRLAEAWMRTAENTHLMPLGRLGRSRGLGPANGGWAKRWQGAVSSLETLLRGPDLWAPHLPDDAYRSNSSVTDDAHVSVHAMQPA